MKSILTLAAGLVAALCLLAPDVSAQSGLKALQKQIKKNPKVSARGYAATARRVRGRAPRGAARKVYRPLSRRTLRSTKVGQPPEGFGNTFHWDRKEDVLLAVFVNAADPLGVSITGGQPGDRISITGASGLATFSKDKGNPLAASIVGLVSIGAKAVATAYGGAAAIPGIDAVEGIVKDQFKGTGKGTKARDAFGTSTKKGRVERQEGGVLVSLPRAGGIYYSGKPKKLWTKKHGPRRDNLRPNHVRDAFFVVRGSRSHNSRELRQSGPIFVAPWDHIFDDNAGFYKVFVLLQKGNGKSTPPVIKSGTRKLPARRFGRRYRPLTPGEK